MTNKEFAEFLLPDVEHDWEYYENLYPERNLDDKAIVTRYAPSPTGLPHMGNLLQGFMAQSFARQSNGVFFIRIEDTDTKVFNREEEGRKLTISHMTSSRILNKNLRY